MKAISYGGVSVLAVGIVVALALVGVSHTHPRVVTKVTTPTTAPNPSLSSPATTNGQRVTYVNTTQSMGYAGMNRSYVISRPSTMSPTARLPVIVVLHGRDVTPAFEEQRTDFASVVNPSILVYPAGYQESWNSGGCCGLAQTANVDDVGFVKAVLSRVKATQSDAAQGQAYLVGYSNGGKLALRLACVDAGDFSGVAVYGATDSQACPNRAPAQILIMAGALDTEIPATSVAPAPQSDGFVPPSFQAEVDSYRFADSCANTPVVTTVGQVTLKSWVHCTGNERVGQAVFANGNHYWPAGSAASPSGEGVAWAWFRSLGA